MDVGVSVAVGSVVTQVPEKLGGAFGLTLTGLTNGEARPGDHTSISFVTDPPGAAVSQVWTAQPSGTSYGTGPSPTDYTASDGETLRVTVTDAEGNEVSRSAPIRYAQAVALPIPPQTFVIGQAITPISVTAWFNTNNLTDDFDVTGLPPGITFNDTNNEIEDTATGPADTDQLIATHTDQYGRVTPNVGDWDVIERAVQATVTPVASPLHDGQTVQNITDWATFTNTSNYSTNVPGASIVSVTPIVTGDATSVTTVLSTNQVVNVALEVADDAGTTETFDLGQITVEYSYTVNMSGENIAVVTINPIVADAWMISVTKTGAYAGTYNTTAGAIRAGPVNLALPTISDDGDLQPGGGEVLTSDDGFWIAEAGTTFTYQWQGDNVDIPSASNDSYTTVAGDDGTDITVEVTASGETAESAAISIPGGATTLVPTELRAHTVFGGSGTLDLSGADEGDTIVLAVTCRDNANTFSFTDATLGGVSVGPPVVISSAASGGRHEVLFLTFARPATASATFTITHSESVQRIDLVAWKVPGASLIPHDSYGLATITVGNPAAYTGGTMGVVNGGLVLAAFAYDSLVEPPPQMTLTPASLQSGVVRDEEWGTDTFMGNAVEAISATNTSRSIEADVQDTRGLSFAAISLEAV